jgi:CheY-like chemotaxis protein
MPHTKPTHDFAPSQPLTPRLTGTLPLPIPSASRGTRLNRTAWSSSPTVLIVDDHEDSRTVGRLVLESRGFHVIEAANGTEGLHKALTEHPSVVLLDIVLPGLDGWEIARRIRADAAMCNTVIIAVTALAGIEDRHRSYMAGCDSVLTKPVPPSTMLAVINQYVSAHLVPESVRARVYADVAPAP